MQAGSPVNSSSESQAGSRMSVNWEIVFNHIDKDLLIKQLQELDLSKILNGKPFFKSYGKWSTLSSDQRAKAKVFWMDNIDENTRMDIQNSINVILANEEMDEVRKAICHNIANFS